LKVEKNSKCKFILKQEYEFLKHLQKSSYVPRVYDFIEAKIDDSNSYFAMELFSSNVHVHLKKNYPLSITKCYDILYQMLIAVEDIHKQGMVHLDIKPSNFVISTENNTVNVKLIDYGLSKVYRKADGQMVRKKENCEFRGTISYASVNAHLRNDLSCRDDLWSFLFVLFDIVQIQLPWKNNINKEEVLGMKEDFIKNPEKYVKRNCIQNEVVQLVRYANGLDFYDIPDYDFVKNILSWMKNKDTHTESVPRNDRSLSQSTETVTQSLLNRKRKRRVVKVVKQDEDRTVSE
jgi:serine/threonine protein kinase